MKLVISAYVTFNRIGSASSYVAGPHETAQRIRVVSDKSPDTLRELVLTIAEEHGEPRENLQNSRKRMSGTHVSEQRRCL